MIKLLDTAAIDIFCEEFGVEPRQAARFKHWLCYRGYIDNELNTSILQCELTIMDSFEKLIGAES